MGEQERPLYAWARVHKEPKAAGKQDFEVWHADKQGFSKGATLSCTGSIWPDDQMAIKKRGKGEAIVTEAAFSFDCKQCHCVALAPCADPVLMMATIMTMEHLKLR